MLGCQLILSTQKKVNVLGRVKKRKQKLEELGFIEKVFPERTWEQKKNDIDILTMGSDLEGKFNALSKFCEIEITERTYGISSTALRMVNLEINLIIPKRNIKNPWVSP